MVAGDAPVKVTTDYQVPVGDAARSTMLLERGTTKSASPSQTPFVAGAREVSRGGRAAGIWTEMGAKGPFESDFPSAQPLPAPMRVE